MASKLQAAKVAGLKKILPTGPPQKIFNVSYTLSKRPHLHSAYVIGGCIFFWLAVHTSIKRVKAMYFCQKYISPGMIA